jgi:phosphatidylserine decarboxylase
VPAAPDRNFFTSCENDGLRIVSDGIYFACGLTVLGLGLSYFFNAWIGAPFYLLAVFCIYFFRDPERSVPPGALLVAPADGRIVSLRQLGPREMRVSIFLNIFNVHVNRAPIAGTITDVFYQKGKFLVASHEAASTENEQNTLVIEGLGTRVVCRQIAGLIARRIVCYKQPGDIVAAGERIGYIRFGSRVDVIFGPEWTFIAKIGDKVSAGATVLAHRSEGETI